KAEVDVVVAARMGDAGGGARDAAPDGGAHTAGGFPGATLAALLEGEEQFGRALDVGEHFHFFAIAHFGGAPAQVAELAFDPGLVRVFFFTLLLLRFSV